MSKIKTNWVHTDLCSFLTEVPQSKKVWERQENRRINQQVKRVNRHQQSIMFTQYGRVR